MTESRTIARPRPRVLVVCNPRAGGEDDGRMDTALAELKQGADVEMLPFESPDAVKEALRRRLSSGDAYVVVAAGGDGTVSFVAGQLAGGPAALGILPMGTANDCARTLAIPDDPVEAARVILQGYSRTIDLGLANGRIFLNAVGIGISVAVSRDAANHGKKRLGVLSYAVTAVRAVAAATGFRVELSDGDRVRRSRALQVTVANGRHYGGGMTAQSDARIDDGFLDVLMVKPASVWRLLRTALHLRSGRYAPGDPVHVLRAKSVRIRTRPPLPFAADGEERGTTPLELSIRRAALEVIVPVDARPPLDPDDQGNAGAYLQQLLHDGFQALEAYEATLEAVGNVSLAGSEALWSNYSERRALLEELVAMVREGRAPGDAELAEPSMLQAAMLRLSGYLRAAGDWPDVAQRMRGYEEELRRTAEAALGLLTQPEPKRLVQRYENLIEAAERALAKEKSEGPT